MGKIRVFIADDNERIVETLVKLVSAEDDMEVAGTAKDGVEVIEQIKEVRPDVLLLDIIMPRLDGIGVMEKIREMENESEEVDSNASCCGDGDNCCVRGRTRYCDRKSI